MRGSVRHLYVHVPFCAHRCGYCDFVTVVGREGLHGRYVDALLAELELEREALAKPLETVFLGGGTPTLTSAGELRRLLEALPPAGEVTVEANPETVTPELAKLLREAGVTRVSLGAQTFRPELLRVLERQAGPDDVRRAFYYLRDASFDNISVDLLHGIPGQSASDLELDIEEALALAPEHVSYYELEAKPGTRFTHAPRSRARATGRSNGGLLRARHRAADRFRLPLVRDGELLPGTRALGRARPALSPQPRLLAWSGLPRAGNWRRLDARRGAPSKYAASERGTSSRSRTAIRRSETSSCSTTGFGLSSE